MARILISSDCSLCVEFGNVISEEINRKVNACARSLSGMDIPGIVELVPTYRSLTVHYLPEVIDYDRLYAILDRLSSDIHTGAAASCEEIHIPVLYGGEWGPDLSYVAKMHKMTEDEVADIHCSPSYLIYMMGFLPGFCYLGGLDERIATPRLTNPRTAIPEGSVGIAGGQTGIYPVRSPGGWQLIGRTPLKLYDPYREDPILLHAGMGLRFYRISPDEYNRIWEREHSGPQAEEKI